MHKDAVLLKFYAKEWQNLVNVLLDLIVLKYSTLRASDRGKTKSEVPVHVIQDHTRRLLFEECSFMECDALLWVVSLLTMWRVSSWTVWCWIWRHYEFSECRELVTKWRVSLPTRLKSWAVLMWETEVMFTSKLVHCK